MSKAECLGCGFSNCRCYNSDYLINKIRKRGTFHKRLLRPKERDSKSKERRKSKERESIKKQKEAKRKVIEKSSVDSTYTLHKMYRKEGSRLPLSLSDVMADRLGMSRETPIDVLCPLFNQYIQNRNKVDMSFLEDDIDSQFIDGACLDD